MEEVVAELVTEATGRGVSICQATNEVTITGYAKTLTTAQVACDTVEVVLGPIAAEVQIPPLAAPVVEPLAEEDWATAWQHYYHPLRIGRRLVIKPRWEAWPPEDGSLTAHCDDIVIELDPQMAFGTGTHPCTQLCLEATETLVATGDIVADVGCGSGILSIAAARLGAKQVVAVDNDPVAAEIAAQNVKHNGVGGQVRVVIAEGLSGIPEDFNLIVANINPATISSLARELASHLLPGGHLVASGIVVEQADDQTAALTRAGLVDIHTETRQDWICLIGRQSDC